LVANKKALFPGETAKYRAARNKLLRNEIALRRATEKVAAERRKLPLGGAVAADYVFDSAGGPVKLSQLFDAGKDTLLVYNFMFGPQMAEPCPSCSSILDSVDGAAPHVTQRANLVIVAKSPIDRILAFTRGRGWGSLRLLSSGGNTYNRDYGAEADDGSQLPIATVFVRRDGRIHHFWSSETWFVPPEPGQNPRHVDFMWPLWAVLDRTQAGRGSDWWPSLDYR